MTEMGKSSSKLYPQHTQYLFLKKAYLSTLHRDCRLCTVNQKWPDRLEPCERVPRRLRHGHGLWKGTSLVLHI